MIDKKMVELHIAQAFEKERNDRENMRDYNNIHARIVEVLGEMALLDIVPDGRFSDIECEVWGAMRRIICEAKNTAE